MFNVRPDTLLFTRPDRPAVAVPLAKIERAFVADPRIGSRVTPGLRGTGSGSCVAQALLAVASDPVWTP